MPDPDHDAEAERRTDPRFDAWPIHSGDAYADWAIEHSDGHDVDALEWVGVFDGGQRGSTPYLFDPERGRLVAGRLDADRERVVVEEDAESHDVEDPGGLGEHLRAIGEDRGWTWLSAFAEDHLEADEVAELQGLAHEGYSFDRKNLVGDEGFDMAFVGSHTFTDATGRAVVLEREFDLRLNDRREFARIEVREDVRVAEDDGATRSAGDADLASQWTFELAADVDADAPAIEEELAGAIEAWHREHTNPGAAEPTGQVSERSAAE